MTVITRLAVRTSATDICIGHVSLPVTEALCSGLDAFAVAVGPFCDAGVDGLVIGKIRLDFLAGRGEVDNVGRRELVSDHDHELVLRQDLNERGDCGVWLLHTLEVEFALDLGGCRILLATFGRHGDGS